MLTNILEAKGASHLRSVPSSHPSSAFFPSRTSNPVEPHKHFSRAGQALLSFRTSIPAQCSIVSDA
ncbi:hypothetical protein [Bacteroides sp. CAG:633]|uniref:hypothetical protein n=1 Tax=Bacteroides sp. CAG:633 TaxID=1262744 RepID=UPI000ABD2923|nr:hypothetical protein [Bacteroides sp. CAG:633]